MQGIKLCKWHCVTIFWIMIWILGWGVVESIRLGNKNSTGDFGSHNFLHLFIYSLNHIPTCYPTPRKIEDRALKFDTDFWYRSFVLNMGHIYPLFYSLFGIFRISVTVRFGHGSKKIFVFWVFSLVFIFVFSILGD